MDKISIIVPVYNVEAYLSRCLDSIVHQTYKNLEIILVNDGSKDSSLEICNKYAHEDSRITVINKENGGQSSARNMGLDIATGNYIGFVDSDDWIEPKMYENLLSVLLDNKADVAVCEVYNCNYAKGTRIPTGNSGAVVVFDDFNSFCDNLFIPCQFEIRFEIWNKLFRRNVLKNVRFKEGQLYEEIYFMRNVLDKTGRIVCIGEPLYDYVQARPGSTISSFNISRLSKVDEIDSFISLFAEREEKILECKYVDYAMNAILELYLNARHHHASRADFRMLKSRFNYYYDYAKCKKMVVRMKFRVFSLSPSLYYVISSFLSKTR